MFLVKDEIEIGKLVSFYTFFTSVYFPFLILILVWTDAVYIAGNYKFNYITLFIALIELAKFILSGFYFKFHEVNLSKKYDDKRPSSVLKNVLNKHKIREAFKSIIVVFLMIFIYFVISILYGAEAFNNYEETFTFSTLLSILTIFPACVNLGPQSVVPMVLGSKPKNKLENLLYQNAYLTVFGAWLGAFVIPLDWDRPWQKWPISCSLGGMTGFALSHFLMMFKISSIYPKKSKRSL